MRLVAAGLVVCSVLGLIGLFILGWTLREMRTGTAFRARAVRAAGVVVDHLQEEIKSPGENPHGSLYYPIVRFTTVDGQVIEAAAQIGSSNLHVRAGELVPILYDPESPRRLHIDDVIGSGAMTVVVGLSVGALMALIGVIGLWSAFV